MEVRFFITRLSTCGKSAGFWVFTDPLQIEKGYKDPRKAQQAATFLNNMFLDIRHKISPVIFQTISPKK